METKYEMYGSEYTRLPVVGQSCVGCAFDDDTARCMSALGCSQADAGQKFVYFIWIKAE